MCASGQLINMAGFHSFFERHNSWSDFDYSPDYSPRPVIRDHSISSNSDYDSEPQDFEGHSSSSHSESSPRPVIRRNSSLSDSEPQDYGGYSCSFVSEPPDVYTCLICTFVAKDCQQMSCCGKIYCRQCLAENKKQSKKCPNCREAGKSFNDIRGDREIKALEVKCDNLDNGCEWVGELCSLEKHMNTCGYVFIPCTLHCKKDDGKIVKVLDKYLENHLNKECPRRKYQCPHCREMGEYKERTTLHMDSCPKVKVQCPNTPCKNSMPRCDVTIHRSLCDYEKIMCKFSDIGCQEIPFRKSLKDHEEDLAHHLPLIIANSLVLKKDLKILEARNNEQDKHIQSHGKRNKEQDIQIQSLGKRSKEQDTQIQSHGKRNNEQDTQIQSLRKRNNEQDTQIQSLRKRNNEQDTQIQSLRKRSKEQDTQIQSLGKRSKEQDTQIQTLEKRLQLVSSSLPFTFKMKNYQRFTEEQKHFTSPSFYSSGYKFSVRILTGSCRRDDYRRGSHLNQTRRTQSNLTNLSLRISLMKGKNDDSLTWPFTGSVTVELLNQLEDDRHALVTIQFKAEDVHSRRVTDGETGTECNRIEFDPDEIVNGSCNCLYLHKDSLVFRVSTKKPWLQCTFKH